MATGYIRALQNSSGVILDDRGDVFNLIYRDTLVKSLKLDNPSAHKLEQRWLILDFTVVSLPQALAHSQELGVRILVAPL